jgi:hypothetical protein
MLAEEERLKVRETESAIEFYLSKLNSRKIIMLSISGDDLLRLQGADNSQKAEILHRTISALQRLLDEE